MQALCFITSSVKAQLFLCMFSKANVFPRSRLELDVKKPQKTFVSQLDRKRSLDDKTNHKHYSKSGTSDY